jgi:3'-phosphoadenosine 5'-phosphosulfate sulfotransferase (PAPS reductase)/FAD synthetase
MTTANPRHICLISGGKDSTALALYMRDKRPDIDMEYVFCDTHKELEETYEYLNRIEATLGKEVVRLSAGMGERGFDHFLEMYRGYLPSPSMRWCTRKLKIEPFEKYVGDDPVYLYVGIRADENREGYISTKPNITPIFPFKEDGINKEGVMQILEQTGVGLPNYYEWRTRSGCYFCFFQRKIEWVGLMERHPELFEDSKTYEKLDEGYTWVQGESLDDIEARADDIRTEELKRQQQAAKRRRPKTLAEAFTGEFDEPEEESGCLICHL